MNIIKIAKRTGCVVVVLAALYVVALIVSGVKLRNAQAELVAAGYPTKAEQIIPPPVKDEDNAALLYQAAVQRLKSEAVGGTNLYVRLNSIGGQSPSNQASQAASNELIQLLGNPAVTEALRFVELGSAKPTCRFDLDYTCGGARMKLPHIMGLRDLSRIVCARMRLEAARGDTAAVWRSAKTALALADATKQEPVTLSYLVRLAQIGITCEAIRDVCVRIPVGALERDSLDRMLASMDNNGSLMCALSGERILFGDWIYDEAASGRVSPPELFCLIGETIPVSERIKLAIFVGLRPLFQLDHTAFRRVCLEWYKLAERPTWDVQATQADQLVDRVPRLYLFTRSFIPTIPAVLERQVLLAAEIRLTQAALAVSAYKQKTGGWPKDLHAAGCGTLLDPLTGKPFVCRLDERGPMVYSVGPDLKDDGGQPLNKGTRKGDIVWRP